jgi:hypothetical protein
LDYFNPDLFFHLIHTAHIIKSNGRFFQVLKTVFQRFDEVIHIALSRIRAAQMLIQLIVFRSWVHGQQVFIMLKRFACFVVF